jgi:hypothetical protein
VQKNIFTEEEAIPMWTAIFYPVPHALLKGT